MNLADFFPKMKKLPHLNSQFYVALCFSLAQSFGRLKNGFIFYITYS
ncbi:hypothetical protein EMIT0210MI2_14112 [Priestia megaterium]